jgi:hypothetical protein
MTTLDTVIHTLFAAYHIHLDTQGGGEESCAVQASNVNGYDLPIIGFILMSLIGTLTWRSRKQITLTLSSMDNQQKQRF